MATQQTLFLQHLPPEIRARILRNVFQDGRDLVVKSQFVHEYEYDEPDEDEEGPITYVPEEDAEGLVDDGVTLACRWLRDEAKPEALRQLTLTCVIEHLDYDFINLGIKECCLHNIRRATFNYMDGRWRFDFTSLPALEFLRLEYFQKGPISPDLQISEIETYVKNDDIQGIIGEFKERVERYFGEYTEEGSIVHLLHNQARGFPVEMSDLLGVVSRVQGKSKLHIVEIEIDWDTSAPVRGEQALLEEFESIVTEWTAGSLPSAESQTEG